MNKWLEMMILLICFVLAFYIGIVIHKTSYENSVSFCDLKYGENNWYWNETTGTDKCRSVFQLPYIGQCWECVNK